MQGGEEARSETYLDVRENDERRSQRRRWAFFSSLLALDGHRLPPGIGGEGGIAEPEAEGGAAGGARERDGEVPCQASDGDHLKHHREPERGCDETADSRPNDPTAVEPGAVHP